MKKILTILTYVLGVCLLFDGSNFFMKYFTFKPYTEGEIQQFVNTLTYSGYLKPVKMLTFIVGLMIVLGYRRPLAYLVALPIIFSGALFELYIVGMPNTACVLFLVCLVVVYQNKEHYQAFLNA
jgi:uncharacterized membrane protein YphA (DoxX/SURF4 family)